jgi:cell division GTPase FtsZ
MAENDKEREFYADSFDCRRCCKDTMQRYENAVMGIDMSGAGDDVRRAKQAILSYITTKAILPADLADLKSVTEGSTVHTGVGKAWGPGRGEKAVQVVLSDVSAKCDLNEIKSYAVIIADDYINMFEINNIFNCIRKQFCGEEHGIYAATNWLGYGDDVIEITIIASDKVAL